jgi:hypothetical protein
VTLLFRLSIGVLTFRPRFGFVTANRFTAGQQEAVHSTSSQKSRRREGEFALTQNQNCLFIFEEDPAVDLHRRLEDTAVLPARHHFERFEQDHMVDTE